MKNKILSLFFYFLFPVLFLTNCSKDEPFLLSDYRYHEKGQVTICLNNEAGTLEKAKSLAETICTQFDRTSNLDRILPYQCSWFSPTEAIFSCRARPGETPSVVPQKLAPMRHDTPLQ
jgi:hypothetical protein